MKVAARTVAREELKEMLDSDEDLALVEVLAPEMYGQYHLPGAINVPMDEDFAEAIQDAAPDKERTVAVYCRDTRCQASARAARIMAEHLGYTDVYDYEAGKEDWRGAGLPVEE